MIQTYRAGVNLGGWISQYRQYDHAHFQSFITEKDIEQIAGWGMDHVRLPVDYPVLESDDAPGEYREDGFVYVDRCLKWCEKYRLGLILDLHHAPGYSFTNTLREETKALNTLFTDPAAQQRFIGLWEFITRRYLGKYERLVLELMNEVVLPDTAPWNDLIALTVAALRKIDAGRAILIGGNHYNHVNELKNLVVLDDPNVHYTFHFYEPLLFTHQKAQWVHEARLFDQTLEYPGDFTGLQACLDSHPQFKPAYEWLTETHMNRNLLVEYLQPARDFINRTGLPLYCGEFGVIDGVSPKSIVRWHADLIDILDGWGIGGAVWSYKQMSFGLVDADGNVVNQELIKVVSRG